MNEKNEDLAIHTPLCIEDFKETLKVIEVAIKSDSVNMNKVGDLLQLYRKYETVIKEFENTIKEK